jgi:hypothetical protein
MAGAEEDDLGAVRRLGASPVHQRCKLGLGRPQVEAGERAERLPQRVGVGGDQR